MTHPFAIQLFIAGRLTNPLNGSLSRAHWSRKSEWANGWKHRTKIAWLMAGKPTWDGPAIVTFHGRVARLFDDEGFIASCKPCRDAAVTLILGTGDGPTCGHEFHYRQEVRPAAERGVLVEVMPK